MRAQGSPQLLALLLLLSAASLLVIFGTNVVDRMRSPRTLTVREFLNQKTELAGLDVRVSGLLVQGGVVRQGQPCDVRLEVEGYGTVLLVHYARCGLPEIFGCSSGMDLALTVEGQLDSEGVFQAQAIGMSEYLIEYRCPTPAASASAALSDGGQAP